MNPAVQFFFHTETGHFILYIVASNAIGSMPSPGAASTPFYVWAFRFLNGMASNLTRAFASKVESSPNFQDAVNKLPGPVNKPVIVVEAPKP